MMTQPAAFRATYSDLKLIKTRQCVQIVFELPLADFDAAYQILGGMPNSASETWFGIAPLVAPPAAKEKIATPQLEELDKRPAGAKRISEASSRMDWRELQPAAQAGIRCADPVFWKFLNEKHSVDPANDQDAAYCVRFICGVKSRSELGTNHKARVIWHQLDESFLAWKYVDA